MSSKLFVAGFPYALTEAELQEAFAKAGTVVSAKVITEKETGRSRGFGFVEMSTDEEAETAIQMWNGNNLGGRALTVNVARPMERRPHQDHGDRGDRGDHKGFRRDRGQEGGSEY